MQCGNVYSWDMTTMLGVACTRLTQLFVLLAIINSLTGKRNCMLT